MKTSITVVLALVTMLAGTLDTLATPALVMQRQRISLAAGSALPCSQLPFGPIDPEGEFQPHVAVHPHDPTRLAVVWTQGLFSSAVVGLSNDAGRTWRQVPIPLTRCSGGLAGFVADPWIVWSPDGTMHVAAVSDFQAGPRSQIVVTRSSDGGATWAAPVVVENDGRFNDRENLAVDPQSPNHLYLTWTKTLDDGGFALALARSVDGGRTWTTPELIHRTSPGRWPNGITLVVLPDGSVVGAFEELGDDGRADEMVLRSTDRGESWTLGRVATTGGDWAQDPDSGTEVIGHATPALDVAADGSLVLAWQDASSPGASKIWVARSSDGGVTWDAAPVREGPGQAWGPSISVGPRGTVAVTWYDTRHDVPGDGAWTGEVWAAHAHHGQSERWTETRLTGPFDLLHALRSPGLNYITLGNYFGLQPAAGGFAAAYAVPTRGSSEAPQDIEFALLEIPGWPSKP